MEKKKKKEDYSLDRLINKYLSHIEVEKNYSKYTIRNYRHYLSVFKDWFEKKYEQEYIEKLTTEMVQQDRFRLV